MLAVDVWAIGVALSVVLASATVSTPAIAVPASSAFVGSAALVVVVVVRGGMRFIPYAVLAVFAYAFLAVVVVDSHVFF